MEVTTKLLKKILNSPFYPPELETNVGYFRTQDDCDGDTHEGICVSIGTDGDVFISARHRPMQSCRYRMPMVGGGRSPRTRLALLILALAIKLDDEER